MNGYPVIKEYDYWSTFEDQRLIYIAIATQRVLYLNIQHESSCSFFTPKIYCCNNVLN